MATTTIIEIAIAAVAVIAVLIVAGVVLRRQRTEHRRNQAGEIRDDAAVQAHQVAQGEALADEVAARARVAAAEADASSAHAAGLQHQAEVRRGAAATARDEVNEQFRRADALDPDTDAADIPSKDYPATVRGPSRRTG
jgi:type VI protein secretion system component VasK